MNDKELKIEWSDDFYDQLKSCFVEGQCDEILEVTIRAYGFDVIYSLDGVLKDCEIYWSELDNSLRR